MPDQIKQRVERFYNEVGWQQEANGLYQNAQYEDLRPVSADYIARGHARVGEHLAKQGEYLLDAGSGPVQYEDYLKYSQGYARRVCFDLSSVALQEARKRLGEHGFYVVGDVSQLPFKAEAFDGIVSLHTIHHLPMEEKIPCYEGLYRCLKPGRSMATVDGWGEFSLSRLWGRIEALAARRSASEFELKPESKTGAQPEEATQKAEPAKNSRPAGTYVAKTSANWFKQSVQGRFDYKILSWRSVSVRFLRNVVASNRKGQRFLAFLSWLEDRFPKFFGENGQYPLIVIKKPAAMPENH